MEFSLIVSFLAASILLTLMPGPDNIFVLTESLTNGKRNGIAISIGLCVGVLVHTFAAATGLSIIIQQSELAFTIVSYLGAVYLFYLAFQARKDKKISVPIHSKTKFTHTPFSSLVKKGFFMNVLNPKVSLFFIAFLPQFTSKNGFDITLQMLVLGLIFMVQALFIFSAIANLASQLTPYANKSKFWKIAKWSKIGILIILGFTLLFSKA